MSFYLTKKQFEDGSKDVTRRDGWVFLKVGDRVMGVEKSQGLGPGGKVNKLGAIIITAVSRERLDAIIQNPVRGGGRTETAREGFPELTPGKFVEMVADRVGMMPDKVITRIEFIHAGPEPEDHIWVRSGRKKVIHYLLRPQWAICGRILKDHSPGIQDHSPEHADTCPRCKQMYLSFKNAPRTNDP